MRLDGIVGRLVALAVAGVALWGIHAAGSLRERPAVPAAGDDCVAREQAEIERRRAAGEIGAEQAMIARQRAAASCADG